MACIIWDVPAGDVPFWGGANSSSASQRQAAVEAEDLLGYAQGEPPKCGAACSEACACTFMSMREWGYESSD